MKVLLFTPSYNRPYILRQCMLNSKNQSYTDFTHSIGIMYGHPSEVKNYDVLFDDLVDERFVIQYHKNSSTHTNAMKTISQCEPHDLYLKIDDDDIYKKDYVKTIVDYFKTHNCDILSSSISYQINNHRLFTGDYRSLGGDFPNNNFLISNTLAFNRKAYEAIKNILDNHGWEDLIWRVAWSEKSLIDHNVDNSKNVIWHIHGKNISVGDWVIPDQKK